MGQYYIVANRDKRQYIHAHAFGEGLKYGEFTHSAEGTMTALAFLLASTNPAEAPTDDPLFGSWAGDRIVVAGDYGEPLKLMSPGDVEAFAARNPGYDPNHVCLHNVARELYADISSAVRKAMQDV